MYSMLFGLALSLADVKAQLYACADKTTVGERSACYFLLVTDLKREDEKKAQAQTAVSNWQIEQTKSKLDDKTRFTIFTHSVDPLDTAFGERKANLVIACNSQDKLMVYIDWRVYIGYQQENVSVRFGSDKPVREPWLLSTNGQATFMPGYALQNVFKLQEYDRLIAQVYAAEGEKTVEFNLKGLNTVFKPFEDLCN